MKTYISLLRGINVSGKNLLKMQDLKSLYQDLGFSRVQSYIQSGNLVFSAPGQPPEKLEEKIRDAISTRFSMQVPVLVIERPSLQRVLEENPFSGNPDLLPAYQHITFLNEPPGKVDEAAIREKLQENEQVHIRSQAVYLYCPGGYGKTRLNNSFLEKKLGVEATTRNLKTSEKLLSMAEST